MCVFVLSSMCSEVKEEDIVYRTLNTLLQKSMPYTICPPFLNMQNGGKLKTYLAPAIPTTLRNYFTATMRQGSS